MSAKLGLFILLALIALDAVMKNPSKAVYITTHDTKEVAALDAAIENPSKAVYITTDDTEGVVNDQLKKDVLACKQEEKEYSPVTSCVEFVDDERLLQEGGKADVSTDLVTLKDNMPNTDAAKAASNEGREQSVSNHLLSSKHADHCYAFESRMLYIIFFMLIATTIIIFLITTARKHAARFMCINQNPLSIDDADCEVIVVTQGDMQHALARDNSSSVNEIMSTSHRGNESHSTFFTAEIEM